MKTVKNDDHKCSLLFINGQNLELIRNFIFKNYFRIYFYKFDHLKETRLRNFFLDILVLVFVNSKLLVVRILDTSGDLTSNKYKQFKSNVTFFK
jgi:hypothetical protein